MWFRQYPQVTWGMMRVNGSPFAYVCYLCYDVYDILLIVYTLWQGLSILLLYMHVNMLLTFLSFLRKTGAACLIDNISLTKGNALRRRFIPS